MMLCSLQAYTYLHLKLKTMKSNQPYKCPAFIYLNTQKEFPESLVCKDTLKF